MRAWELVVKGIIDQNEATAEALERKLAEDLHAVVSKSYYGAHYSVLGTPSVHGAVHIPQIAADVPEELTAAPAPAPAPVAPILQAPPAPAGAVTAVPAGLPFTAEQLNAALAQLQQMGLIVPMPSGQEVSAQQQ